MLEAVYFIDVVSHNEMSQHLWTNSAYIYRIKDNWSDLLEKNLIKGDPFSEKGEEATHYKLRKAHISTFTELKDGSLQGLLGGYASDGSSTDSVYQAGMDINLDMEDMRERIESINQANKYLKLIDEAVELMRKYHPQGEKYYWVLYYTYMSAYRAENTDEILDKLEPHFPRIPRMHRATYFRWRDKAFEAVSNILWGYETKNQQILKQVNQNYQE